MEVLVTVDVIVGVIDSVGVEVIVGVVVGLGGGGKQSWLVVHPTPNVTITTN